MAAYGALVSLMNDLELIPNHQTHSFSFDNTQITSLSQTVHFLIDFMETYDSHGCTRDAAQVMERQIASAAHAAHDVIESHVVDKIRAGSSFGGKLRSYFLLDLQKAIDNMYFVKRKAMQFKAKSGLKAEQPTYSAPTSSEPLTTGKNLMVGFDAVVIRLLEMLTGEPSNQRVIPIVGMGGLGKTTLAKNVYEHSLIKHHFDVCVWATISQEYNVENILTELLFRERRSTTVENVGELGDQLHKMLWGRKYLIVLDDMWSVEAWNEVQIFLPDNGNGSRVIVTTRLSNLATNLSSSPIEMNFLEEGKSWELFCGKAFGEEECPVELEEIGKKIVRRCRGLPLSIVVIGGHLRRSSKAIEYWEKVANYMNPISSLAADEQCLNIISLSYHHLPPCLKPCFLYMGIFEEDERIFASKLVEYWVVEGFVKSNKSQSLEEVAEDYLKDLNDRNLIIVRERGWNGKIKVCVIHDIVRELCLKVGKNEKFMCVLQDTTQGIDIERERRIVIPEGKKLNSYMIGALGSAPLLRSLIRRGWKFDFDVSWVDSRLLRISAFVNNMNLKKDGARVHFLQLNLRYQYLFNHKSTNTSYLHLSLSLFWNMQNLSLLNFGGLVSAPYEIWEMPQLRNLQLRGFCLSDADSDTVLGKKSECIVLGNLHTLLGLVNLRLTEEICKRMPNVKKLRVVFSDWEANAYDYYFHNLGRFNKLESLKCEFDGNSKWRDIVSTFTFPTSLEELSLSNCHLDWEDLRMMIKSLPHLGSLHLEAVQGADWDLVEEELEFPCLKELSICGCDDLIYWNANSSHFPVLEHLEIWEATNLNEIPFDIGETPTLRVVELRDCSVSAAVSAMKIVVEQESFGNQDIQLDVAFWKMENVDRFQKMLQELGLTSKSLRLHKL